MIAGVAREVPRDELRRPNTLAEIAAEITTAIRELTTKCAEHGGRPRTEQITVEIDVAGPIIVQVSAPVEPLA